MSERSWACFWKGLSRTRSVGVGAALMLSPLVLTSIAAAQSAVIPAPTTGAPQNPGSPQPGSQNPVNVGQQPGLVQPLQSNTANLPGQLLLGGSPQGGGQGGPDEFTSIWSRPSPPQFSGFPVFPARLPGYGGYPLPAQGQEGDPNGPTPFVPLPAAEPLPAGWPSWVRAQSKRPLPYAIDLGLLISQEGRVWHRATADEPFVPLFYHDKFASLAVGATAESRGTASFEVLLEGSTRIQTRGVTSLTPTKLDEENVHVTIHKLSWMRLTCSKRINIFTLPDGSTVELQAAQPAPVAGLIGLFGMPSVPAPLSPPLVELRRLDEPGWYGGRATMTNLGGTDIVWNHAFGRTVVAPSHRVTFFISPPTAAMAAGLVPGMTQMEHHGEHVTCKSTRDTEVQWCGARIELRKGTTVTFESLGGEFAQPQQPTGKPSAGG